MPDNEVLISELSTKAVNPLTMFELENTTDGEPDSGKTDASALGNFFLGQGTSPLEYADLQTTAKTPIGAINELDNEIADKAGIDDSTISADSAYSSQKIISLMPTNEATGTIASFKTQLAAPLVDVTLQIDAQQASGTPAPINPLPITGFTGANIPHCGKNLFDKNNTSQILNAYITSSILENNNAKTIYIKCKPSTTYTISKIASARFTVAFTVDVPAVGVEVYTSVTNNTATEITYTTGSTAKYLAAFVYNSNVDTATLDTILSSLQIEESSSKTEYQNYIGSTTSVDWTDDAGTVYGGELDLLSGKLTGTHTKKTISELTSFNRATFSGVDYFQGFMEGKKLGVYNAKCEVFALGQTASVALMVNNTFMGDASYNKFYFRCDEITSATDFITQFGNYNILYELETPIEYQLTPQQITAFVGANNIWHDANGDTDVKFKQDIQGYIDEKIASVQALVLNS